MIGNTKIVQIGEHVFQTPELLKSTEVLFVNEKRQDAYWRRDVLLAQYRTIWFDFIPYETLMDETRTWYDDKGQLASLNKEDSDYIRRTYQQEIRRRTNGVWFKNGNDYEYLTGDHYFCLMWAKMTVIGGAQYADYREYQRDYFYLIKKVNEAPNCLGLWVSKAKKTGITNLHWIYYLNKSTLYSNQNMGCMNINKEQAAKTFKDYFMYSFAGLPSPLKPQVKSIAAAEGRIEFGASYNNSKANKKIAVRDSDAELNTNVFCVATAAKAFDVAKMNDTWYDEGPKFPDGFEHILTTNKEAVKMGAYINGRIWGTSYTPDEDSKSFRECREVYFDAKLRTMKETKTDKTKNEMWSYHIPSYISWIGEHNDCFSKYGKCDEAKAMSEIDEGRRVVKGNSRKLQAITRQYAKNEKEAWTSAGAGSTFDLMRLGEILAEIEIDQEHDQELLYEEGDLEWTNKLWEIGLRNNRKYGQFCPVEWVPFTEEKRTSGKVPACRKYYDVPKEDRNLALKNGKDEYGNLLPPDRFFYVIGGDPTSYAADGVIIEGSKNGGYAMRIPDPGMDAKNRKIVSKTFGIEYYHRPELPAVAYEVYLKMIIYTGGLSIIEANQEYVSTRLMEEGMGYYMIVYDENKVMSMWKPYMGMAMDTEKTYTFIKVVSNQSGKNVIVEYMVRLYKDYFHYPEDEQADLGRTCKSARLLKQMMDLDPTDTKKSDLFMAGGYTLIAEDIYRMLQMVERSDNENPDTFAELLNALSWH